ncbi:MAG: hypothetical protein EOO43_11320 [Flavobacterium sp.]|nr:MAG: hypothetical protein EOO43_11320 [Flavobacterium sp.]
MKTIRVKEFEVPVGAMGDVAGIITDNELVNTITGVDEDGDFVYVEVRYEKGVEEEQEAIHEIQDVIDNYEEEDDEEIDEEEKEG